MYGAQHKPTSSAIQSTLLYVHLLSGVTKVGRVSALPNNK